MLHVFVGMPQQDWAYFGRDQGAYNSLSPLAPYSPSTTAPNPLVPRSFSDLPHGHHHHHHHHNAAGSDVSSETSRASAGASLEKFFTQMGMDREVIDPLLQKQQQQQQQRSGVGDVGSLHQQQQQQQQQQYQQYQGREVVFESISSLESYDARSICSALSLSRCSEKDNASDGESYERNQLQASAVERNARILKWLSNVKKAKAPTGPASSSSSSSSAAVHGTTTATS
ncbi:uncharacterized protein LOC143294561 [Babylonia areolata]|uniref:uncharacterized protein LOC143294561 n=1 Tax=Babylonia areolata TaxID=304850 RepID=UPI003FCF51C9